MQKTKRWTPGSKISHGSKSWLSKFKLIRREYLAGENGFVEVIEVINPPNDQGRFFIHKYNASYQTSSFSRWENFGDALNAFNQTSGLTLNLARRIYMILEGFVEMTDCKQGEDPWFYQT